jgi:ACR3 family arsenite transporter
LALNFAVVPAVVWALFPLVPTDRAIQLGVLLVLLCPCVDYVIVFSKLAGGDGARLLAATPILLLVQFALLPIYVRVIGGVEVSDAVSVRPFLVAFGAVILAPLIAAWLVQWSSSRSGGIGRAAGRLSVVAEGSMVPLMMLVLFVVIATQIPRLDGDAARWLPVAAVYLAFAAVMVVAGTLAGRLGRLPMDQRRAVVFTGVTRNSLVVLPLALALPVGMAAPAAAAVVLQTCVELVVMAVLVAVLGRPRRLTAS